MTSRGGGQGFCDASNKALVIKSVTKGGGLLGSIIVQNCVTSFMDDIWLILVKLKLGCLFLNVKYPFRLW